MTARGFASYMLPDEPTPSEVRLAFALADGRRRESPRRLISG
jgi:hypothetical protein